VLGINSEAAFLLTVKGASAQAAIRQIEQQIAEGTDPTEAGASSVVVIPFSKLRRIQVGVRRLQLDYPDETDEARERRATFKTKANFAQRQVIAQEIARATGRTVTESSVDLGLLTVLRGPAVFAVLTAGLTWLVYSFAADIEAGKNVVLQGQRKGFQQLIIWLASILGTKVTLAIGGLFLAGWIGLAILWVVKRPQIHRLELGPASD